MASTVIVSTQIKDGEVKKDDLNTTEAGQAVITKLTAGTGITLTASTGADAGTGEVTLEADNEAGDIRNFETDTIGTAQVSGYVYTLPNSMAYVQSGQSLEVFLNGMKQYNGVDFLETSTTTITLQRDIDIGDQFLFMERHGYVVDPGAGAFELDGNGALMPAINPYADTFFELDGNDDIQPQA